MRNARCIAIAILAFALLLLPAAPAWAQEGDGGSPIPLNEYGTPDMAEIDLALDYAFAEQIALIDVPLVGEVGINLSYDVYADNHGNTWIVPDPFTILYTAIYPEALPEGLAGRIDGWTYGSLAVSIVEACGGLEAMGIEVGGAVIDTDQQLGQIIRDFFEMEIDHLAFMGAMWDVLEGAESLPLWQLAIVYSDDPFDPTDDPDPTAVASATPWPTSLPSPTPRPTATPMPTPPTCPPESVSQRPPSMVLVETWPPNPVVAGQGGQGLDVTIRAVSYPVVHRWWTREREYTCTWWDVETYGEPWGHRGNCCPEGLPTCDRGRYYYVPGEWFCQEHVQLIPDPILIDYLGGAADLHESSIAWIESDLAQKYPGARVRHPRWGVAGEGRPYFTADWRCIVEATVHFPFVDPGWYDVAVHAQTAGTVFTPPRSFSWAMPEPQPVYLLDTMLIR